MNFNFFGIVERDHLTQIYFLNFPLQKKKKKKKPNPNPKQETLYLQTNKQAKPQGVPETMWKD